MLRMPAFRFRPARSVQEAVDAHAESKGRAMYVAGGTDLIPNMKRRQFEPPVLVGIRRIEELKQWDRNEEGDLLLGAGVTLRQIAEMDQHGGANAALREAAGQVATLQIQRMGTLGGNLCVDTRCNYYNQTYEWRRSIGFCLKKDGDGCLVAPGSSKCWAVSSSDTAPVLIALGASVTLVGPEGSREMPVSELYRDDGIEYMTRRPEEILTAVRIPHATDLRSTYVKVRRRGSFDFPILGVAAAAQVNAGTVTSAHLVLGAVHTHPVEVPEANELLAGKEPTDELFEQVADAAYRRSTPLDNTDLSLYWRKRVTRVNVVRALRRVLATSAITT